MDLVQETDLLRKVPMFAKLEASKLKLLAFTSEIMVFDDGDVVFHAGDQADCAYVIMDGAVDIVTDTAKGSVIASTLRKNQLFGEMALLNNAPRNATLVASGTLQVMKITGEMFLRLLSENADLALDVMRQLSDKLAKSHRQVEELQKQVGSTG